VVRRRAPREAFDYRAWRISGTPRMRASGTGKLKGIKGGGTYKGTAGADGSITYAVEGEYSLPAKNAKK